MAVIQIRKAQREGARVVLGVAGVSGSGKTLTALLLAYGMANGDGSKIGFLDTENKRGSLYADDDLYELVQQQLGLKNRPEPFQIGDLDPPFSPERYIAAMQEFQKAGVEVLVVDSASHEWEGTGGCIELAESTGKPGFPNWNKAKALHKKFVNALLQTDMHIIACIRAREKDKPEKIDGKTEYVKLGLQPIAEKNLMFEMTASVMMRDQGARQEVLKCPAALQAILGRGEGYITAADGLTVRNWIDGAKQLDPKVEKFRNKLLSNCEPGEAHIRICWSKTPDDIKAALGPGFLDRLVESAKGYDEMRADEAAAQQQNGSGPSTTAPAQGGADVKNAVAAQIAKANQTDAAPPAGQQQMSAKPANTAPPPTSTATAKPAAAPQPPPAPTAPPSQDGDFF